VAAAAGLFIRQQIRVRDRSKKACFSAFLNNNWVGLAVFAGLLGHYAWLAYG
jgi:4-hydroxybenzoate polyprenyltransferase